MARFFRIVPLCCRKIGMLGVFRPTRVLMAILGVIFPKFLVKAIKSTDKNDAGGGLLGSQITFGMLMLIIGIFLNSCI